MMAWSLPPCLYRRALAGAILAAFLFCLLPAAPAAAQEPAKTPAATAAQAAGEHESGAHEEGILPTIARLTNFIVLVGLLVYFLKSPIAAHLASRHAAIRQDLVAAAELRRTAATQLAEIEERLKTLPAELAALRAQGAEDLKAEQERITRVAASERQRLLEQTRREIDMRLRVARRELTEHAASLAIGVAEARIRRSMTPEDHVRLVERYTSQLKEAR